MKNFYCLTRAAECGGASRVLAVALLLSLAVGVFSAQSALASEGSGRSASEASAPQKLKIKGQVLEANGNPIIGATISVKGHPEMGGVITNAMGEFTFNVPDGSVIQVTYIGYQTAERTVSGKTTTFKIVLAEAVTAVEDVVVVGYGTQKKESVVGSISQVTGDGLVQSGNTNITNAIAGKMSGVLTMQSSGQPGANDADIFIRGVSSWNGSKPLVMVDGVERSFSDIDPNEVSTISVLKDASATAVFGAKGANGVILVTTKTGVVGKPKMNLAVTQGFNIPAGLPKHISSYTTGEIYNIAMMNAQSFNSMYSQDILNEYRNPSSRINSVRYPDNNWFDLLLKGASPTTNVNFNMSGGSDKVKYFVSVTYDHDGTAFKKFHDWKNSKFTYDRLSYRSNLDFNVTKSTVLSVKVGGTLGVQQYPTVTSSTSALMKMLYSASPMMFPAYYPGWILEEIPDPDYPDAKGDRNSSSRGAFNDNPYKLLNYADFEQVTSNKLYTDAILEQKLDFITKGLSLKANVSLSTYYSRISQTSDKNYPVYYIDWDIYDSGLGNPWVSSRISSYVDEETPYKVTQGGMQNTYYTTFYWEGALNYNRSFGRHTVTALALFQQRENIKQTSYAYRSQGLVGRVTYDFGHKYLLEANLAYNGSEQFSPSNRYGFFPSYAVGYVLSQEKFWKENLPWWSKMKLRWSDGWVGSDSSSARWLYYASYSRSQGGIIEDSAANLVAQWEESHKRDLGIEMGWLNNDITLNVDLYDEFRDKMLIAPNVTMLVGTSYKQVNRGSMKKHGMEIELGYRHKTRYGLRYNINAMIGLTENRIVNYEDAPYAPNYQKYAGTPYQSQRSGMTTVDSGFYTSVDDIHNYPAYTTNWQYVNVGSYKYLDYDANGKFTVDDLHYIEGSQYPPITYSFGGGINYKGFELSLLFYGNEGKWVGYHNSFEIEFTKGDLRVNKSQLDYWTPANRNASHSTPVYGGASGHPMYSWAGGSSSSGWDMMLKDHTWRRADYLNLKEIYAAYTFNGKKLKKSTGLSSLSIYATANNVWTWTNLPEGNPQITNFTSGFYPVMTTLKFGFKVGF